MFNSLCIRVYVCSVIHVCSCVWGPENNLRYLSQEPFTSVFETQPLTGLEVDLLPSKPQGSAHLPLRTGMTSVYRDVQLSWVSSGH